MGTPVNPAKHLEALAADMLGQRIFAVDFAWGYTLLERHLAATRAWLDGLELEPHAGLARDKARQAFGALDVAMAHLRTFVEESELPELDRGLAAAREAAWELEEAFALARVAGPPLDELPDRARIAPEVERTWQRDFDATVTRHRGESRVTFVCKECGWEFSYVEEAPVGELEVPFSEIVCPLCHPE